MTENNTSQEFIVSECNACKKINWPPIKYCSRCFKENSFRNGSNKGKIIEFSKNDSGYFGIIEFEDQIRVIGKLKKTEQPKKNQDVILKKIIKNSDTYSFDVSISDSEQ